MAVAEPASQATFRTVGGVLLAAFIAASVGFYVHTTRASSEDSPRDMQPGFVYKSEPAMLSMNANGEGTLAPAGTTLANAARNNNRAPKRQQAAASASALLRGIRKNSAAGGPAVQSRSPDNRVLKHADSRQFYAKQKAIQQHHAHHRLEAHIGRSPSRPATFAERKARAAAALSAKQKAAQQHVAQRVIAETKAVRQMEKRIASDLASALKCVAGVNCLERGLLAAEKAAENLFVKSRQSASAFSRKDAASHLHDVGKKFKKPKGYGSNSNAVVQDPSIALGPAASNNFWKEAAVIAEKGPEALQRNTKNSAKTFVKQLAAVAHDKQHAKELAPAVFEIPAISTGPLSSPKSKTFG